MDGFFHAGVGLGPDMMSQMEAMMNSYELSGHSTNRNSFGMQADPVHIPEELSKEARFQPGYDDYDGDEDLSHVMKNCMSNKHNYDDFEQKLKEGTLDAPNLNLPQIPPSVFDNNPPVKMMYLKDNKIYELPEYFFDELPYLAWLDLRDNKLMNLPPLNLRHESLRVMLLQGNRIRTLPYSLALAVNLRTIGLTGNPVTIPPENIQKQGCRKMLTYLKDRMLMRVPMDEAGEYDTIPSYPADDELLREDLKKTALKSVKKKSSGTTINSKLDEQKKADRLIYTWELWKRIPYEGKTRMDLFKKSFDEVKDQVLTKMNAQQEALLQKCKNKEVLQKWRSETRLLQLQSKPDIGASPTESAPFGNDLNLVSATGSRILRPNEFKEEMTECWKKLKEFASFPPPISDTELALQRLREVEEIQKRLMDMRLSVKSGPPLG